MARRAFSSQCRIITIIFLLALLAAAITYPYPSSARTSAKFHFGRDAQIARSSALLDDIDVDFSGNASYGLAKRAIAPMCSVTTAVMFAIRGCELSDLMLMDQNQVIAFKGYAAAVSQFNLKDATGRSGWKNTQDLFTDITPHASFLIGLGNVEEFQVGVRITNNQRWVHSTWTQEKRYATTINGVAGTHDSSLAIHEQMVCTSSDIQAIVILNSHAPKFMVHQMTGQTLPDDQLPAVGRWYDIGYIEYARVGQFLNWRATDMVPGGTLALHGRLGPRWFAMPAVWGPLSTLEVVTYCLFTYNLLELPTWENRVTYPIGSFCFEALLGTPAGHDLAWFLIRHKFRISDNSLGSVTIFGSGIIGIDGYELPTMLWWSGSNYKQTTRRQTLGQIRADNYAYTLVNGYHSKAMPHMLRPM